MISLIIPTRDEAGHLPATLASISRNQALHEVLVVDANSSDATVELARAQGARVHHERRPQRASQMNAGARQARGDSFLFLHADTLLAPTALQQIELALQQADVVGGGFARRFGSSSLFLQATCLLAEARSRLTGCFFGDQAIFVRREIFEALGGFREVALFEDLDFALRLRRAGRVVTLRPRVISSARRFARRGPLRTTLSDLRLTLLYALGRPPQELAKMQGDHGPGGTDPLRPLAVAVPVEPRRT